VSAWISEAYARRFMPGLWIVPYLRSSIIHELLFDVTTVRTFLVSKPRGYRYSEWKWVGRMESVVAALPLAPLHILLTLA
jgi:hypothetical protein